MTKRDIAIRAWIKTHNKFGKVLLIDWHTEEVMIDGMGFFSFDDVIFEQYTGLKDVNGVEIYDGDFVTCSQGCPHRVIWVQEHGGTFVGGMPGWYLSGLDDGYAWTGEEKVIGNVHMNQELLEV